MEERDPVVERTGEAPGFDAEEAFELGIPNDSTGGAIPAPRADRGALEQVELVDVGRERDIARLGGIHEREATAGRCSIGYGANAAFVSTMRWAAVDVKTHTRPTTPTVTVTELATV